MDGTERSTNKHKIKYIVSFIFYLYSHASKWSEIGSSGTPPSSLFYSRPSSESCVNVICFMVSSSDNLDVSLVAGDEFK